MKEKVLFVTAIIGSFSATVVLLITQLLTFVGVDTTAYVDIINLVGIGLAFIILVAAVFFLNKYNGLQIKQSLEQKKLVTSALGDNATLMQTLLPQLADRILVSAEERSAKLLKQAEDQSSKLLKDTETWSANLLKDTEIKVKAMMNEMLPALATQTMQVVTQKSQNIVEETTAKATAVMKTMDDLIPTYAKQISDTVAQTVRENNAHYYKMLSELKTVAAKLQQPNKVVEPVEKSTTQSEEIKKKVTKPLPRVDII